MEEAKQYNDEEAWMLESWQEALRWRPVLTGADVDHLDALSKKIKPDPLNPFSPISPRIRKLIESFVFDYYPDKPFPFIPKSFETRLTSLLIECAYLNYRCRQLHITKTEFDVLAHEVERLKKGGQRKEALFQVGVAVRRRYLEYAIALSLGGQSNCVDKDIIEQGNIACHRASGSADTALMTLGYLSEDRERQIYQELYGDESFHSPCDHLPKIIARTINSHAAIRTLKCANNGALSASRRKVFEDAVSEMYELWNNGSQSAEEFEALKRPQELIRELEVLMEEIIELDRIRKR